MAVRNKPNELYITRIYDAPVKAVWDAWTDPQQVAQWWGPRGFTLTTHSKDLRPGGHWAYTMHGPDGTNYENKTLYHEVEKHSRLVYDHGGNDDRPPLFRVTVTFKESKGKTQMDMTMGFATAEVAAESKKFIKKAGGNGTWDRLAEFLEKESSGKEKFVITRSFAAPLGKVFEMWANPKHFARWLPPTGIDMEFVRTDFKPGGVSFFVMGDGENKFYGLLKHLEISQPNRIVYEQQFADANEKVVRPPWEPNWPETMLTTVTFAEEETGETRVTVAWEPKGKTTREELETFVRERANMTEGWTGSFDKLDGLLQGV